MSSHYITTTQAPATSAFLAQNKNPLRVGASSDGSLRDTITWTPNNANSHGVSAFITPRIALKGKTATADSAEKPLVSSQPDNATSGRAVLVASALQQATRTAENLKTMQEIAKIYDQMWAEVQKGQTQRWQLILETGREVSEMIMKGHQSRLQSSQAHHEKILAAIIDAPEK